MDTYQHVNNVVLELICVGVQNHCCGGCVELNNCCCVLLCSDFVASSLATNFVRS